jgi:hypothetical protein
MVSRDELFSNWPRHNIFTRETNKIDVDKIIFYKIFKKNLERNNFWRWDNRRFLGSTFARFLLLYKQSLENATHIKLSLNDITPVMRWWYEYECRGMPNRDAYLCVCPHKSVMRQHTRLKKHLFVTHLNARANDCDGNQKTYPSVWTTHTHTPLRWLGPQNHDTRAKHQSRVSNADSVNVLSWYQALEGLCIANLPMLK